MKASSSTDPKEHSETTVQKDEYYINKKTQSLRIDPVNIIKILVSMVNHSLKPENGSSPDERQKLNEFLGFLDKYVKAYAAYQQNFTEEHWRICENYAHTIAERLRQMLNAFLVLNEEDQSLDQDEQSQVMVSLNYYLLIALITIYPKNNCEIEGSKTFPLDPISLCRINPKYSLPLSDGLVYDVISLVAVINQTRKFESFTSQPFLPHDIKNIKAKAAECGLKFFKLPSTIEVMRDWSWDVAKQWMNQLTEGHLLQYTQNRFHELKTDRWLDNTFLALAMFIAFVMVAILALVTAYALGLFSFSMRSAIQLINIMDYYGSNALEEEIENQEQITDPRQLMDRINALRNNADPLNNASQSARNTPSQESEFDASATGTPPEEENRSRHRFRRT